MGVADRTTESLSRINVLVTTGYIHFITSTHFDGYIHHSSGNEGVGGLEWKLRGPTATLNNRQNVFCFLSGGFVFHVGWIILESTEKGGDIQEQRRAALQLYAIGASPS